MPRTATPGPGNTKATREPLPAVSQWKMPCCSRTLRAAGFRAGARAIAVCGPVPRRRRPQWPGGMLILGCERAGTVPGNVRHRPERGRQPRAAARCCGRPGDRSSIALRQWRQRCGRLLAWEPLAVPYVTAFAICGLDRGSRGCLAGDLPPERDWRDDFQAVRTVLGLSTSRPAFDQPDDVRPRRRPPSCARPGPGLYSRVAQAREGTAGRVQLRGGTSCRCDFQAGLDQGTMPDAPPK